MSLISDNVGSDIDAYGQYTVNRWFSAGENLDRYAETYEQKGAGKSLTIMGFGLAGEAGEVLEHLKKLFRDGTFNTDLIQKELGDVIFYWARICKYFGWLPSEIIAINIDKLEGRVARGTMRGSGDNR